MPREFNPLATDQIQSTLNDLQSGEPSSIEVLLDATMHRLCILAKHISEDIPAVKRWEQTDDLIQNSMIRLWKALQSHTPLTPLDFYRLASLLIRRELIDMARHHFGPEGLGANHVLTSAKTAAIGRSLADAVKDDTSEPGKLGEWTDFHEYVESLDDAQRLLFDLLWYQGMTLAEAAQVTGSSERTIRRRWKAARISLYHLLVDPNESK